MTAKDAPPATGTITQGDLDALGFFVEAARELRESQFFDEDHRRHTLHGAAFGGSGYLFSGERVEWTRAELTEEDVLRSMLASFRKISMPSEAGYVHRSLDILEPMAGNVEATHAITTERFQVQLAEEEFSFGPPELDVTPKHLVELYINARYMHAAPDPPRRGWHKTRRELNELEERVGEARLKWFFEGALYYLGTTYIALLDVAYSALERWEARHSIRPSFVSSVCDLLRGESDAIERSTPAPESPQERAARYLRRNRYKILNGFFRCLDLSELEAAPFVLDPEYDVERIVVDRCLRLSIEREFKPVPNLLSGSTTLEYETGRKAFMQRTETQMVLSEQAPEVIADQLEAVRSLLATEAERMPRLHDPDRLAWVDVVLNESGEAR